MKFTSIENIWTVDVSLLSNADRGRVYFERAKQIVAQALTDPSERKVAVVRARFRRTYLAAKIGAQSAVTTQNPKIRQLLGEVDALLSMEAAGVSEATQMKLGASPLSRPSMRRR